MNASPVIRRARITLRKVTIDDASAIAAYRSDPDVARYQSWESYPLERALELCRSQSVVEFGARGTWFQLAIVRNEDGAVIGDCGMHFVGDDPGRIELGITMSRASHGQGLASEVVRAMVDLAFNHAGAQRITARVDALNTPARRLFERAGFRQVGEPERVMFKGEWGEEVVLGCMPGALGHG